MSAKKEVVNRLSANVCVKTLRIGEKTTKNAYFFIGCTQKSADIYKKENKNRPYLHGPGDLCRVHEAVHLSHRLGRGSHRLRQLHVGAHRLGGATSSLDLQYVVVGFLFGVVYYSDM